MAQYKKDEIKEKIDLAALSVFAEKGYRDTKIADIGKKADVSVGNIYRYYKSKDEIFHANVPESFLLKMKALLVDKIYSLKGNKLEFIEQSDEFWLVNDETIKFMVENRERMLIVFSKSSGTHYENAKAELVEFLVKTVENTYTTAQCNEYTMEDRSNIVLSMIYENLMNITLRVLEETKDLQEVRQYLKMINSYHMFGITKLFR